MGPIRLIRHIGPEKVSGIRSGGVVWPGEPGTKKADEIVRPHEGDSILRRPS